VSSPQQSISTEAAYYVWGFGASAPGNTVSPWSVPADIFTRSASSFVGLFVAGLTRRDHEVDGLGRPEELTEARREPRAGAAQVRRVSHDGERHRVAGCIERAGRLSLSRLSDASGVSRSMLCQIELGKSTPTINVGNNQATVTALSALNGTAGAANGIGFVSGEVADENRSAISVLAYQHTGQSCGYWPDSTPATFDKYNIRNGQYWLWSPVHVFAASNAAGTAATDSNTQTYIVGPLTGTVTPPAGVDVFTAEVKAYTVPQCAMHVWRDGDLAPLYSYQPPASCSCRFDQEEKTASALVPPSCTTCSASAPCATGQCVNGYCEVN
jgi:transcriptional regulator with XRE-family HTH domain